MIKLQSKKKKMFAGLNLWQQFDKRKTTSKAILTLMIQNCDCADDA